MVKKIRTLSELKQVLNGMVQDCLDNEVDVEVKQLMWANIWKHVYNKYTPRVYERRYENEGLISPDNIVGKPLSGIAGREFFNVTKKAISHKGEYLAPLIEKGTEHPIMPYQRPRPFIRKTREQLIRTKHHLRTMQKYFEKRGIKCEYKR